MKPPTSEIVKMPLRDSFIESPGMYIGHGFDEQGLRALVSGVIEAAIDPETQNGCSSLEVVQFPDGSLQLDDNGRGLPPGPYQYGHNQISFETLWTFVAFNHPNAAVYRGFGHLVLWGPLLNVACSDLVVETNWAGKCYSMTCGRGVITSQLHSIGESAGCGTQLRMTFDSDLFGESRVESDALVQLMQQLSVKYASTRLALKDPGGF